jgi:hypothetical protein
MAPQNWILRAERELWGVLGGPWAEPGLSAGEHRNEWVAKVRGAGALAGPGEHASGG